MILWLLSQNLIYNQLSFLDNLFLTECPWQRERVWLKLNWFTNVSKRLKQSIPPIILLKQWDHDYKLDPEFSMYCIYWLCLFFLCLELRSFTKLDSWNTLNFEPINPRNNKPDEQNKWQATNCPCCLHPWPWWWPVVPLHFCLWIFLLQDLKSSLAGSGLSGPCLRFHTLYSDDKASDRVLKREEGNRYFLFAQNIGNLMPFCHWLLL